ncbi:MAG: hypothetical protein JOZ37_05960 [Actinobacteria bacterium]|nr:hypothetical protein [Actinomycetota bacterium]MBV8959644.1 hypothetical protein [Actinomycetota bacterium]MBV9253616.1 hypothetical protein [Actinomycetota bacterium]MBV9663492.1 hypothetical protein [Actinomycetota bacterium]MBV9935427.1 hypothetical protein [Actinomycetota bacterium]
MEPATAVHFSAIARALAMETRRLGLVTPGFRSPPRRFGLLRTIRRVQGGGAVVAVRLSGRPVAAVAGDMVDGVLAANGLTGEPAQSTRAHLLAALGEAA